MNTRPGTTLSSGRYRLLERLATGGMGEVWRAGDELLGRDVAIKTLKDEYADDETFRIRFRAEARNTAGLSHPGIAQMYDYGEQDDLAYLVMELVPGQPLSEILARNEVLSPEVTLEIVAQAAAALQAAHEAGLIHRDIKPGNLIVDPDGQVKVTDFGIARVVNATTMTQTGTVLGTAQYVSPEQAEGRPLTPSTDIYSLGVVAYECLSGQTPFTGESAVAIALAHVRDEPPPLPADVPSGVRDLVARCLDKDTERRPSTAGELSNVAYLARESLRMGDTEAGLPAAPPDGDLAGTAPVELTLGDGVGTLADMATPLDAQVGSEAVTPEDEAAGDAISGGARRPNTSPLGQDAADATGVAAFEETPYPHSGEPQVSRRRPDRRKVLLMAGAMSVAVVCAGALMFGFQWDAWFSQASNTGGGSTPKLTFSSSPKSAPGWNVSPGWDTAQQEPGDQESRLADVDPDVDRRDTPDDPDRDSPDTDDRTGDDTHTDRNTSTPGDTGGGSGPPDTPTTPEPSGTTSSPSPTDGSSSPTPSTTGGSGDDGGGDSGDSGDSSGDDPGGGDGNGAQTRELTS